MLRPVTAYLVFDIETVVDPDLPIADGADTQKMPASPHHQVVAIGALLLTGPEFAPKRLGIVGKDSADETVILTAFTELVDRQAPTLVTYNGRGFDLPVIAARCLHHGIPFPAYYRRKDMRYRFSDDGHFDLMDYISDFGASRPARLDVMAKLCGMPGKVGVDGKDVGPMVHQGRLSEVRDYCLCDVVQTAALFLRVELLRGTLDRPRYLCAARALLQTIEKHEKVAEALWSKIDLPRFLLGEPFVAPESTLSAASPASAETEPDDE